MFPWPSRSGGRSILRATLLLVLFAGLLWLGLHRQSKPKTAVPSPAAFLPPPLLPVAVSNPHAAEIRELRAGWDEHRRRLQQLLQADYPAALARRNAAEPHALAVLEFCRRYNTDFYLKNREVRLRAWEQDSLLQSKLGKIQTENLASSRSRLMAEELYDPHLHEMASLARALADSTPVTDGLTIRDMMRTSFFDDFSGGPEFIQRSLVQIERCLFGDEAAARQVAALQTNEQLIDYLQAAAGRYQALYDQPYVAAGFDADVRRFNADGMYVDLVENMADAYHSQRCGELHALEREYREATAPLDRNLHLLTESSRDDEESRRVLTEFKEMQLLHDRATKKEFDADRVLQP